MRPARTPAKLGFTVRDRRRLERALRTASDARLYRRVLAVKLIASGEGVERASELSSMSRPAVYFWLQRYLEDHDIDALRDQPRSGRPPAATQLTTEVLRSLVRQNPHEHGYATNGWTVPLLVAHLQRTLGLALSGRTLRRRMHLAGLRWKRPRYVYSMKAPHLGQKKGALFAV